MYQSIDDYYAAQIVFVLMWLVVQHSLWPAAANADPQSTNYITYHIHYGYLLHELIFLSLC